ncbi:MAG: FGGY-family carbohydrate kinase [Chloroflexota bacterium]
MAARRCARTAWSSQEASRARPTTRCSRPAQRRARLGCSDDAARAAFVGLGLRHGTAHLARAVMEGVAFQVRWALAYGIRYGVEPATIRSWGGGGGRVWL